VGGGPVTFGVLYGGFGAGAVLGALLAGRLRRTLSNEGLVRLGFIGFGCGTALAASSAMLPMTVAALLLCGLFWVLTLSTFNVTVQLSAPRWVVGRALALYQTAAFGGMAIGSWIWGIVAHEFGTADALLMAALAHVVGLVIGFVLPMVDRDESNLSPLRNWLAPKTAIDVQARTGPVVVTIEYLIRPEDVPEFLAVMNERRRIRRRDGARQWTLLRDLENAELWIERYHLPTWLDYVRYNQRITQADAAVGERLKAMHQGAEPPKVRRRIERQTGAYARHGELHEGETGLTRPTGEV
jgi:MFS family permease